MLFNTPEFAIFFIVVFIVYWLTARWRSVQNLVLMVASGYFYFNKLHPSFLLYLYGLIIVGYFFGRMIALQSNKRIRKPLLVTGICILGFGLTYIKYSGLILGNIPGLEQWQANALHILVPLGISYYTFCSIGYITDVYRKVTPVEKNFITYSAYISFFPHLLMGPIASSATILPQFRRTNRPDAHEIERSLAQIIWGLFKKMVIADNVVKTVNYCFASYQDQNGSTLFLGVTLFSLYLYCDFSGYSEIAMGVAKLLGFDLTQNFKMPFFSRNPSEFWRRWHTSLRKWMLDYLYLPLGGNRGSKLHYVLVMLFIFSFSGLWHGANYTFICWGLLNGLYFLPYILSDKLTRHKEPAAKGRLLPTWKEFFQILITFNLVTISRVFFRAPDIFVVRDFFVKIFSKELFMMPLPIVAEKVLWVWPVLIVEWFQREKEYVLLLGKNNKWVRYAGYMVVIGLIYQFRAKINAKEYYYFKF